MSLSGAEFKVQGCHKRQQRQQQCPPLPPISLPSSLCGLSQGSVLPNFLAARPFGNLEQHQARTPRLVQRVEAGGGGWGGLYVTHSFKHGRVTSLTRSHIHALPLENRPSRLLVRTRPVPIPAT